MGHCKDLEHCAQLLGLELFLLTVSVRISTVSVPTLKEFYCIMFLGDILPHI
jgi:hypothetical protein